MDRSEPRIDIISSFGDNNLTEIDKLSKEARASWTESPFPNKNRDSFLEPRPFYFLTTFIGLIVSYYFFQRIVLPKPLISRTLIPAAKRTAHHDILS